MTINRWPPHITCNGNCLEGRPCDCHPAVPEVDAWEAGSWRDNVQFWATVGAGTAAFGMILALALGWRP